MAEVSEPTAQEVIDDTGISELATGDSASEWEAAVSTLIPKAKAECIAVVTNFTGDSWTDAQAELLFQAWMHRAAARMLRIPMLRKVLGTHEPLLVEDADAIQELRQAEIDEAQRLEALATAGIETDSSGNSGVPFALPSMSSGTFSVTSSDRSPVERNLLLDSGDNVSGWDTEQG